MRKLVIEKAAIRANMAVVRKRAAGAALYGVLTGDGGGAGLIPLARMLRTRRSSCSGPPWTGRSWSGWWT